MLKIVVDQAFVEEGIAMVFIDVARQSDEREIGGDSRVQMSDLFFSFSKFMDRETEGIMGLVRFRSYISQIDPTGTHLCC